MTLPCAGMAALLCRCLPVSTLRRQIAVIVAVAVLVLAIVTAWVTSWGIGARDSRTQRVVWQSLALNLAQRSPLASVLDSAEGVHNVVAATLAFS